MARTHSIKDYPVQTAIVSGAALIVGAAITALATPRRGSEVRFMIKQRGIAVKDRIKFAKYEIADTAEKSIVSANEVAKAGRSRAKSTASKIETDAKQTSREASAARRRTKKDVDEMTDHIRRNGEP